MEARQLDRIEQAIDVAAAAVFAAAAAFLAIRFGAGGAVAAGFAAFGLCLGLLRSIKTPAAEFVLQGFDPAALPPIKPRARPAFANLLLFMFNPFVWIPVGPASDRHDEG